MPLVAGANGTPKRALCAKQGWGFRLSCDVRRYSTGCPAFARTGLWVFGWQLRRTTSKKRCRRSRGGSGRTPEYRRTWGGSCHIRPTVTEAGSPSAQEMGGEDETAERPSRTGVRASAKSDHWDPVWTPRWVRTSWKVISICRRRRYQVRIACGSKSRSVPGRVWGSRWLAESRRSTQRNGTVVMPKHRAQPMVQMLLRPVEPRLGQVEPARGKGLLAVLQGRLAYAHTTRTALPYQERNMSACPRRMPVRLAVA